MPDGDIANSIEISPTTPKKGGQPPSPTIIFKLSQQERIVFLKNANDYKMMQDLVAFYIKLYPHLEHIQLVFRILNRIIDS